MADNTQPDIPLTTWSHFSAGLEGILESTLNPGSVTLIIAIDTNAEGERVQIDNISFQGDALPVPLSGGLTLFSAALAALRGAGRRRRQYSA